jgi:two-component system response regulator YesN
VKFFTRFKSVYYTLIISYIVLTLSSISLISWFLLQYFSSNFNKQIEKVNQNMLHQISNAISYNIVDRVEDLAMGMATEHIRNYDLLYLFEHPLEGNHIKIPRIREHLSQIVSMYPEMIDSIQVYYKSKDLLISSKMGVVFLEDHPEKVNLYMDWLADIDSVAENMNWVLTRPATTDYTFVKKDIMTLVTAYPFSYQGQKSEGYIAINVLQDAFYSILHGDQSIGDIIFMGQDGRIISLSSMESLYDTLDTEDYMNTILSSKEPQGNFIQDIDGVKSMVSYVTVSGRPWKIINIVPIEKFYKQSETISRVILGISGAVLILGIVYSGFFTKKIYNPLRMILVNTGILDGEKGKTIIQNEYNIINRYIDDLSIKVDELETTLQYNLPLIKYNLVYSLFYNHIASEEVLSEQLNILKYRPKHPYFNCVVFLLEEEQVSQVSEENKQFIKFNIISHIEGLNNSNVFCLAVPLSDTQTGVIINTYYDDYNRLSDHMMNVVSYVSSNFKMNIVFGLSRMITNLLEIHLSYDEVLRALEHQYFMPERQVFYIEGSDQSGCTRNEMPEWIFDKFLEGLNLQDLSQVEQVLTSFKEECRKRIQQSGYCHQQVLRLLNIFAQYIRGIDLSKNVLGADINEEFSKIKNIEQFIAFVLRMSEKAFMYIKEKYDAQTSESVLWAVDYIRNNLHEDISLQSISDRVQLTPHYFSKIFKSETGVNFIDFLTDERMKKALELITTTDIKVEQISEQVGFSSSSYFIRQFKKKFGLTPGQYRQQSTSS